MTPDLASALLPVASRRFEFFRSLLVIGVYLSVTVSADSVVARRASMVCVTVTFISFVLTNVKIFADISALTKLKNAMLPLDTNKQADRGRLRCGALDDFPWVDSKPRLTAAVRCVSAILEERLGLVVARPSGLARVFQVYLGKFEDVPHIMFAVVFYSFVGRSPIVVFSWFTSGSRFSSVCVWRSWSHGHTVARCQCSLHLRRCHEEIVLFVAVQVPGGV